MTDMDALVAFLRARVDAEAAEPPDNLHLSWCDRAQEYVYAGAPCDCDNPARIVREVEARRLVLDEVRDMYQGDPYQEGVHAVTLAKLLALPDAGHPDYREEWRA